MKYFALALVLFAACGSVTMSELTAGDASAPDGRASDGVATEVKAVEGADGAEDHGSSPDVPTSDARPPSSDGAAACEPASHGQVCTTSAGRSCVLSCTSPAGAHCPIGTTSPELYCVDFCGACPF